MAGNPPRSQGGPDAWDEYWRLTPESAAHKAGGPQEAVLKRFWSGFFANALFTGSKRMLDIACGNGAVAEIALEAARIDDRSGALLCGLDSSFTALQGLTRRFPTVRAIQGDSRRTPFADCSFDLITSQFGLEYAGPGALDEAARVLAPGGTLAAVLHLKDGVLFRENVANREAMQSVVDSRILPLLKALFDAHAALRSGKGSRPGFRHAETALAAACAKVAGLLERTGRAVAGGAVARLQEDVVYMSRRMDSHDAAEVARWVDLSALEAESYGGRMASMIDAAVDESALDELATRAESRGLTLRVREKLPMGSQDEAGAWVLVLGRV